MLRSKSNIYAVDKRYTQNKETIMSKREKLGKGVADRKPGLQYRRRGKIQVKIIKIDTL